MLRIAGAGRLPARPLRAFIVERMATKDDVRTIVEHVVGVKLNPISDELASIRRDLN